MSVEGKWVVEVWATGVEGAAKITVMYDEEPNPTVISKLKASATGAYRVAYQEWPMPVGGLQIHGHKITPPTATRTGGPA